MTQKITVKLATLGVAAAIVALAVPTQAFAHVVVAPNEALTGAYETFTASVPNEKDVPVTGLRLVVPASVESVTPTVKPGWEIQTKKSGDKVTEISWTGGTITPELRDVFTFSAHLPSRAGEIEWKAYQTYQDGSVVAWDQKPGEDGHHGEDESEGPYSVTMVSADADETHEEKGGVTSTAPYAVSLAALALSAFAAVRATKK